MNKLANSTPNERVPLSRIRRRIGEHMTRSLATSAHVTISIDVDYTKVSQIRQSVAREWSERNGYSLSYLPFVARSVVAGLAEYKDLNASIDGKDLVRWLQVNLGIAVDLDGKGLVVPVIDSANKLEIADLAHSIRRLGQLAADGKLKPGDVQGGTFTITSQGAKGVDRTSPIINQPQVAILAIDLIRERPVVTRDGSVSASPVGALSLSFDHRAVDGVYASGFLRSVCKSIEQDSEDLLRSQII